MRARTRSATLAFFVAWAGAGLGCGASGTAGSLHVQDAERARAELARRDERTLAPEAFGIGDRELQSAREANKQGDAVGRDLYAQRALAAYRLGVIRARRVRATETESQAKHTFADATEEHQRFLTERQALEREAIDLEKRLHVAREAELPPASGPVDPARERARRVAADVLLTEAKLLCGAARLVLPTAGGLAEAEGAVEAAERDGKKPKAKAPIDAAGRARAGCLASLTRARRGGTASDDQADTLLSELSRSGAANAPGTDVVALSPVRDERGVVVTLRRAFDGPALTTLATSTVTELGRVAAAHPTFPVQLVVHAKGAPDAARDEKRGAALTDALTSGGADRAHVKVEQVGARAPVVDPNGKRAETNERVDVVFVTPGAGAAK